MLCAGENWNQVMYDGMRTTNPASAVYFLFIVLIGNYVMLNLFLAILLDKFGGGDTEEADKKRRQHAHSVRVDDGDNGNEDGAEEQSAAFLMTVHVRAPLTSCLESHASRIFASVLLCPMSTL